MKTVPAFVVPNSEYRSSVPLLIGTDVIRASRSNLPAAYGKRYLSQVKQSYPKWYTALLEVGGSELSKKSNMVGPAVYTGRKISILGGKEIDVWCRVKVVPQRLIQA